MYDWREDAECRVEDPELSIDLLPGRIQKWITVTDGHWIWGGQVNNKGYGVVWAKYPREPEKPGDKRPAHLVVYERLVKLVEVGLELDHTCPFKLCVFPLCMDEVTHAENQRRIGERQKTCRKAGHPRTPENIYRDPTTGRTRCIPCMQEAETNRPPRERGAIIMTYDWRDDALCRGYDPEIWFPVGTSGPALLQITEAKAVCRRCPVAAECLAWALESGQDHGVWGGMSEDERRAIRRKGVA